MIRSESITELAKAQLKVQAELKDIGKGAKGYGYNYTSFDDLVQYLRPLLTKHGISFIQSPIGEDGKIGLTTLWMHESGEFVEESFVTDRAELKGMNIYQTIGSAITYYRRYMLSAFVGIASEEDTDTGSKPATKKTSNSGW